MKNNLYLFLFIIIGFTACKQSGLNYPTDSDNNKNLNSLMTLKMGKNILYLQDFVMNPAEVDSITGSSGKLICQSDSKRITAKLTVLPDMERLLM